MARQKKSAPSEPVKGRAEERYDLGEDVAANMAKISSTPARRAGGRSKSIESFWPEVLEAARMGYELSAIAKALGLHRITLWKYMKKYPEKKREFDNAQNVIRDLCVNVILDAAKKGNWIPAAWMLERTRGMEFAKPEVKLQFWDRQMANDQVEQRIAGKSIAEISEDLKKQYQGNDNVQKYLDRSRGYSAVEDGSNVDIQPEPGEGSETDT